MDQEMIPLLAVRSVDFEKDLRILKQIMSQLEAKTHSENAYRFSERAEMAAGWWFYDIFVSSEFLQRIFQLLLPPGFPRNKKSASIMIVDMFQNQLKKSGSSAWVKMHGDIPFAAPWWSWLMK